MDSAWTYLLGPFLSFLPRRWRESLPFSARVRWGPAAVISGLAESVAALVAVSYWYMYAMTAWVGHAVDSALNGKLGPEVTPQQVGSVALAVWASHPLTLLLAYAGVEGAIRLCGAAFSDHILGTFPLFLFDKVFFGPFRRRKPRGTNAKGGSPSNLSSCVGAVRERVTVAMLPMVADELWFRKNASEEILEIHSCRRKENWNPPRVVRYEDAYYRLETDSLGSAPRPFHYLLRRLPVGVPGRTVLLYSPPDAIIKEQR
jgi:hypothetical protein